MKETARIVFFLILAVIYFILPFDIIPDHLGKVGKVDDFLFFIITIYFFFLKPLLDEVSGTSRKNNRGLNGQPEEKIDDPWEILEVEPGASMEEIKEAYHQKIRQYHPDLVDKLGPEIQKVARDKSQKLNQAFEILKSQSTLKD